LILALKFQVCTALLQLADLASSSTPQESNEAANKAARLASNMNILHKAQAGLESLEEGIKNALGKGEEKHSHTHLGTLCDHLHTGTENRFHSFAPQRAENEAKWFVDGCGYMWAVSVALEEAKESIWILDWWLSPELYLRRPPSVNHQYRLDRMLFAAADRGVKVNIIVYKEVASVLTCELKSGVPGTVRSCMLE